LTPHSGQTSASSELFESNKALGLFEYQIPMAFEISRDSGDNEDVDPAPYPQFEAKIDAFPFPGVGAY